MNLRRSIPVAVLAVALLFLMPHHRTMSETAQYLNNRTVQVEAVFEIDIYGNGTQLYDVSGTWDLSWSDPVVAPDDHIEVLTEITGIDLNGEGISIQLNGGLPSPGNTRSIDPGIDFPAESFFDVYYEIELSGMMPGDPLHNDIPARITGIVDDFPSYFDPYTDLSPVPATPLLNWMSEEVGMMRLVQMEMTPFYPPEVHIILEEMKGSEYLEPYRYDEDYFRIEAGIAGPYEVTSVEFSYRPAGSADPWTLFDTDTDGSAESWSTVEDKGSGDGWSGYLDRWSLPPDGELLEFQAVANTVRNGPISGITPPMQVEPMPPFPEIVNIPPDSAKTVRLDSLVVLLARLLKNLSAPVPARVQVFPFGTDFKRTLTPVNQLPASGDTTRLDSMSCGPFAAASCLKYFADHGHPELDNPGGDTSKPNQTGEQMGRELRTAMKTNASKGTTPGRMVSGIKSYLSSHGKTGWTVKKQDINDYGDIGDMFDEFEADGEDVMMVLENTLPNGKTVQHCVTLGSKGSVTYEYENGPILAMCVRYRLDFMDPWGGEGTEQHEYNVGGTSGAPTLEGYKVNDDASGNAVVKKFIKVSPPEAPGGSSAGLSVEADPGWIEVYAGVLNGGGIIDTFYWDTTGFPGGLYLLEIVADTPFGETRENRLIAIPQYTVDADPPTPESPTKLMGSYPNPFNPSTNIEFYLARRADVELTVYDAAGRTVRRLVRGSSMPAGVHSIEWNGVKDGGGTASSGVYFYRFRADGVEMSSKLVLIR